MEQQVRFCTASDGIRIAYAALDGGGEPIIYAAGFPTHLEMEWERPSSRALLDALSDGATLIRYDMRGCGLSDTQVDGFSIAALVRDLEAVVEASGARTFSLLSLGMLGGPIAMTYAAANAERVSRLVVCSAFARGERLASTERRAALIEYTEKFGFPVLDYVESRDLGEPLDRTGRDIVHLASSPAVQASLLRTFFSVDVTPLLGALTMPATVLHGRGDLLVCRSPKGARSPPRSRTRNSSRSMATLARRSPKNTARSPRCGGRWDSPRRNTMSGNRPFVRCSSPTSSATPR